MAKKVYIILSLILLIITVVIFKNWFIAKEIIGGDWLYYNSTTLREFPYYPSLWAGWQGNGLGGVNPLLGLGFFSANMIIPFVQWLHLPWVWIYKICWFGLYLLLSIVSVKKLYKVLSIDLFGLSGVVPGILIFLTNTYALLLVGGGQMGVAIAYATAPLVLANFIELIDIYLSEKQNLQSIYKNLKLSIICGLVLGFQVLIDLRIVYVTLIAVTIYFISKIVLLVKLKIKFKLLSLIYILLPGIIAFLLNSFWLLPLLILKNNPLDALGTIYTSVGALKFFSFADFSHALSLLHPNWPENIFGKTYFLQPEFLILPILTFSSLFFLKYEKNKIIVIFSSLLALTGIFLAKGAGEPFSAVFVWAFEHVPGFVMFRDPTKFYLLIVIGYSVLIPYTLKKISEIKYLNNHRLFGTNEFRYTALTLVFIFCWIILIRQAIMGQLGGTFTINSVPKDYYDLENYFSPQNTFFRTVWVPRFQRFGFSSIQHPAAEAIPLFNATDSAELKTYLDNPETPKKLSDLSVKYLILPTDPLSAFFVTDRKYDESIRVEYKKVLDHTAWLKPLYVDNIILYETPNYHDLFWSEAQGNLKFQRQSDTSYTIEVDNPQATEIVFSENYHQGWKAEVNNIIVKSQETEESLNSFNIPQGQYQVKIFFDPQRYVNIGFGITVLSLITVIGVIMKQKHL